MNSFENNTPLPTELHPGTDRAMDGLLQEFGRQKIADDEAFLASLEAALDSPAQPEPQTVYTSNRFWKWGLVGSAAACVGLGLFMWNGHQRTLKIGTNNPSTNENPKPASQVPESLSPAEINKRLQRVADAKKIEVEGDERFASGDYAAALEKFDAAFSLLPNGSATAEDRGRMISKFSTACLKQADNFGKMARFDDAKAVLNRVLVTKVDPNNASAKTLLKRLGDPDYYNPSMTEGHYRGMNESTTDFATRRRDHYVAPNLQAPAPSIDKSLPEIPDGAGTTSSYAISGFSMPAAGGIGGAEGGLRGSGRGGAGGGGIGTGYGPGNGNGNGIITRSGTGTLTLSGSTQGGPVRRRMVVPENGLGYVGNNGTTGDYREENPNDPISSGEKYSSAIENAFLSPLKAPLSTFSVDVDTASYANLRRMIQSGQNVPPAAVRIEEMVNYFTYSYPQPEGPHPFSVQVESAACPWNEAHRLVKIGLKAKEIAREKRPSANLVFLCDVSGSMNSADKLPLLVQNLTVLTNELNADDSVGIVVYAGSEGVALQPTSGGDKQTILRALTQLSAGGSTNGGAGIKRAYQIAQERFIKGGINRVILCTDGDFNVGTTSRDALVNLVEEKARGGVFLTVCGYGQGNLNDSMMEAITNKGNGVYHYVDSEKEGKKIFKDELFGTLMTVAKDVKLQVEFNPAKVGQYRLVGYDNRMLKKEDFANDKVDAGDIGAGHTVTALYEVISPEVAAKENPPDSLKYQSNISKMDSHVSSERPVVSKDGEWVIRKYPDGHFTKTKADLDNKQMTREDYDSEKALTKTTVFNMDDKGRLKNGLVKDPDGIPTGTVEFGYGKNDEINEKRLYNAKGELVQRVFPPGSLNIPQNEKSAVTFTYPGDDLDMVLIWDEQNGVGKAEDDTFQPGLPILRWEKGPNPEMLTVKLRYKEPEGTESKLLEVPHTDAGQPLAAASSDFKFASAVAEFGEWIRGKRVAGRSPWQMAEQAESARGNDPHGLRGEFIELVKKAGSQRQ